MKLNNLIKSGFGLCVGLDPDRKKMPAQFRDSKRGIFEFNKAIIDATKEYAIAYKPNFAFYEVEGANGWEQLAETITYASKNHVVIADAKRGDIGNTADAYAKAIFEHLNADMATVSPYLGEDSITPFTKYADKGIFLLAVTSNPSSAFLQEEKIGDAYVFERVISMANSCNINQNVGLVVGATKPHLWDNVIAKADKLPLLVPGIGAQGGDLELLKLKLRDYKAPIIINMSRSILYASNGKDFENAAELEARRVFNSLNAVA